MDAWAFGHMMQVTGQARPARYEGSRPEGTRGGTNGQAARAPRLAPMPQLPDWPQRVAHWRRVVARLDDAALELREDRCIEWLGWALRHPDHAEAVAYRREARALMAAIRDEWDARSAPPEPPASASPDPWGPGLLPFETDATPYRQGVA